MQRQTSRFVCASDPGTPTAKQATPPQMQGVESHQSPKKGCASEVLGGEEKTGLKTAAAWISAAQPARTENGLTEVKALVENNWLASKCVSYFLWLCFQLTSVTSVHVWTQGEQTCSFPWEQLHSLPGDLSWWGWGAGASSLPGGAGCPAARTTALFHGAGEELWHPCICLPPPTTMIQAKDREGYMA